MDIKKELFKLKDEEYKNFHKKLIPTVDENTIIGVRTPQLRKFSKEIFKSGECKEFLNTLPHEYYEENNLHAFLIEQFKDYNKVIEETKRFLPFIDNWATCDMFRPKIYKNHTNELINEITLFIRSDKTYTVRYGIGLLHSFYLDGKFSPEYLKMISHIKSDEYYINMMIAWYFQTALVKQYEHALPYIEEKRLDKWVHNKIIQKCVESFKIDDKIKEYLKKLRI